MKMFFLIILVIIILILSRAIYLKLKGKENENFSKKELDKFDENGNELISKEEFISRLRYDIVELTKYVSGIIEKDSDDNINHSNLIKAISMLEENGITDENVQDIINLRINVEKYYNLV